MLGPPYSPLEECGIQGWWDRLFKGVRTVRDVWRGYATRKVSHLLYGVFREDEWISMAELFLKTIEKIDMNGMGLRPLGPCQLAVIREGLFRN